MRNLCNLRSVLNITWQLKENLLHVAVKRKAKRVSFACYVQYLLFVSLPYSAGFYWFFIRPYAYRWKPCYGQKGYVVCMPCDYEVHGIDISHYQGSIDWVQLTTNKTTKFPIHFVFMKATEGGDHADDTFPFNFDQAHRYGFIRGAYHFFSPKTDPLKQADFFIRTVQLIPGDLPPVLDVETIGKSTPHDLRIAVKTWLDRIESHYGVKPILYTSYKFKTAILVIRYSIQVLN